MVKEKGIHELINFSRKTNYKIAICGDGDLKKELINEKLDNILFLVS